MGEARPGKAGVAWLGEARLGKARQDRAGIAGRGRAVTGMAGLGVARQAWTVWGGWLSMARVVWPGGDGHSTAGMVGTTRYGEEWLSSARVAWQGKAQITSEEEKAQWF